MMSQTRLRKMRKLEQVSEPRERMTTPKTIPAKSDKITGHFKLSMGTGHQNSDILEH